MHIDDFEVPDDIWTYQARPATHLLSDHQYGVVDGDTYDVLVDTGFDQRTAPRIRSLALDTAEIHGVKHSSEEYSRGIEHRDFVREFMASADAHAQAMTDVPSYWPLLIRTEHNKGARGRWLAEIYDWRGNNLAQSMVDEFGEQILYDE